MILTITTSSLCKCKLSKLWSLFCSTNNNKHDIFLHSTLSNSQNFSLIIYIDEKWVRAELVCLQEAKLEFISKAVVSILWGDSMLDIGFWGH